MQIEDAIYSDGFHIIDNFLEPAYYQALQILAEQMFNAGQFRSAKIGHQFNAAHAPTIRNDKICWLDDDSSHESIQIYLAKIRTLAETLNQTLFLGLVDFETHFSIYQSGSFYKKHIDQFATMQERRISCVYYLNNDWHESFGGQLTLYDKKNQRLAQVLPQGNRLICFSSDLPHEVCETKQTRYSLAGWMKTRPLC